MSIYYSNAHLEENDEKFRFIVDRDNDFWSIFLIFPKFDPTMAGEYVFIASNEQGFDEAYVRIKTQSAAAKQKYSEKAPQFKEVAPEVINIDPDQQNQVLSYRIQGDPLPHVEAWINRNGKIIPCRKVLFVCHCFLLFLTEYKNALDFPNYQIFIKFYQIYQIYQIQNSLSNQIINYQISYQIFII